MILLIERQFHRIKRQLSTFLAVQIVNGFKIHHKSKPINTQEFPQFRYYNKITTSLERNSILPNSVFAWLMCQQEFPDL